MDNAGIDQKIETPQGIGRYISFDSNTGMVTVEMDNMYEVEYPGDKCYPIHMGTNFRDIRKQSAYKPLEGPCRVWIMDEIKGEANEERKR